TVGHTCLPSHPAGRSTESCAQATWTNLRPSSQAGTSGRRVHPTGRASTQRWSGWKVNHRRPSNRQRLAKHDEMLQLKRKNTTMIIYLTRLGCFGLLAMLSTATQACESGSVALFSCDAANSRKFIELCAPSPLDAESGYLYYRFGSLDKEGEEKAVEL